MMKLTQICIIYAYAIFITFIHYWSQGVILSVLIHDIRSGIPQDPIDVITVTIEGHNLSPPNHTYAGVYGIADISLAYVIFHVDDQYSINFVQPGKYIGIKFFHLSSICCCFLQAASAVVEIYPSSYSTLILLHMQWRKPCHLLPALNVRRRPPRRYGFR